MLNWADWQIWETAKVPNKSNNHHRTNRLPSGGIDRDKLVVSWGTSVLPASWGEWQVWRVEGAGSRPIVVILGPRHPILEPATRPTDRLSIPRAGSRCQSIFAFANLKCEMCSLSNKSLWGCSWYAQDVCYTLLSLCSLLSLSDSWLLSLCFLWVLCGRNFCSEWGHYNWTTSHRVTLCFLIVVDVLFVSCSWEEVPLTLRTLGAVTRQDSAVQCWFFNWHCLVRH